jgi:hypothetical protein
MVDNQIEFFLLMHLKDQFNTIVAPLIERATRVRLLF